MERLTGHGLSMPKLGLGTYRMTGNTCSEAVERAIELGFRHIDTAEMYGNEDAVGAAIEATGRRTELHLTTKVWYENLLPDALRRSFDRSLRALKTDYVDLYLIHWPAPKMDLPATLQALEALHKEGRARAIGVSNFPIALMRQAIEQAGATIACNQVEHHVLLGQEKLLAYARSKGVAVTSYAPLAQGRLADQPELLRIAKKHDALPAQVGLKWLLDQDGVAVIPKAQRVESQKANLAALDLVLDDEDRAIIAALPKNQRFVAPPFAPAWD